jgi:hypothetical protein
LHFPPSYQPPLPSIPVVPVPVPVLVVVSHLSPHGLPNSDRNLLLIAIFSADSERSTLQTSIPVAQINHRRASTHADAQQHGRFFVYTRICCLSSHHLAGAFNKEELTFGVFSLKR